MKMQFVQGFVQATAETAEESLALINLGMHGVNGAAPEAPATKRTRKVATKPAAKKAYKKQYYRDCPLGCGKRVKGSVGEALHISKSHKDAPRKVAIKLLADTPETADSFRG